MLFILIVRGATAMENIGSVFGFLGSSEETINKKTASKGK